MPRVHRGATLAGRRVLPAVRLPRPVPRQRKTPSKNRVKSFYKCRECKKQFTATVGTIFEDTKAPLSKWLAAF